MKLREKKNLFLYVLFFVMFAVFAFRPYEVRATGAGSSAITDITYVDAHQTTTLSGQQTQYYLHAGISGTVGTYTEPLFYNIFG